MTRIRNGGRDEFPTRDETKSALVGLIGERGGVIHTTAPDFNVYEELADRLDLSRDARTRRSSGSRNQTAWRSEVGYCRLELVTKGLLQSRDDSGRGVWALTREGKKKVKSHDLTPLWAPSNDIRTLAGEVVLDAEEAEEADSNGGNEYTPDGIDRRLLVERQIRARRGQRQFRNSLRGRYGDRCLVTGCVVLAVLEAAHISPYRGANDNHPQNGLLLRSDIHTLFDLDLLGIEPEQLLVELHPGLAKEYGGLVSTKLGFKNKSRPSEEAIKQRYKQFRQRLQRPI